MVAPNSQNGYTLVTPNLHAVTLWRRNGYTLVTPMMRASYTQVTPRLHSVHSRVTRGSHAPNYVRACTCPCPATSTQSTRVAPSHPRRIRCTVGLRLHAGSAPTSCQGYNQVTHGWNAGYALVTPWSRPGNQATLEQHPVHHGATPGSRGSQAQVTPGVHPATPW